MIGAIAAHYVEASGGGGGFSPADLTDQVGWFKGDTLGADGSAISSWPDSFSVGTFSQATGSKQPTVATRNGVKVAAFTANKQLTWARAATRAQPFTLAMLVKWAATPTAFSLLCDGGNVAMYANASAKWGFQAGNGTAQYTSVSVSASAFQAVVITFNGTSSTFRVDEVPYTPVVDTGSSPLPTSHVWGSSSFSGDIAELIAIGHAVTGTELSDLEAYLATRQADLAA